MLRNASPRVRILSMHQRMAASSGGIYGFNAQHINDESLARSLGVNGSSHEHKNSTMNCFSDTLHC